MSLHCCTGELKQTTINTKGLTRKTIVVHGLYKSFIYTFLCRLLQNKDVKWQRSASSEQHKRRQLIFRVSIWNWKLSLHVEAEHVFRAIGELNRSGQLQISLTKNRFIFHYGCRCYTKKPNGLGSKLNGSTRDLCLGDQTDSQVSSPEHVAKKTHSKALLCCMSLANQKLLDVTRLACKFDLHQSERKSSQVNASARKPWPNWVASIDPSSQLASSPFDQGFIKISLLSILVYSLKGGYVV